MGENNENFEKLSKQLPLEDTTQNKDTAESQNVLRITRTLNL